MTMMTETAIRKELEVVRDALSREIARNSPPGVTGILYGKELAFEQVLQIPHQRGRR